MRLASTALVIKRLGPWLVYIGLMGWTFWWGNRVRGRASDTLDQDVTDH